MPSQEKRQASKHIMVIAIIPLSADDDGQDSQHFKINPSQTNARVPVCGPKQRVEQRAWKHTWVSRLQFAPGGEDGGGGVDDENYNDHKDRCDNDDSDSRATSIVRLPPRLTSF